MKMQDLSGKVAVVTGASSGIGVATARLLAEEGVHVVLAARRRDDPSGVPEARHAPGPPSAR